MGAVIGFETGAVCVGAAFALPIVADAIGISAMMTTGCSAATSLLITAATVSGLGLVGANAIFGINEEAYKYYMNLVDKLDVSTARNTTTFYLRPENRKLAEKFVKVNGKVTLEMTSEGKYLDDLKLFEEGSQGIIQVGGEIREGDVSIKVNNNIICGFDVNSNLKCLYIIPTNFIL